MGNTHQPDVAAAVALVASPGSFAATTPPVTAACLGCHDTKETASHATVNTTTLGETCAACHESTADFSMGKVHARVKSK